VLGTWPELVSKFRERFPDAHAPEWAKDLTYAWPPFGWDGKEPLPEVAVWDLANQPTTYDFLCWLMIVKTLGAKRVHFAYYGTIQDWKYPKAEAWKRFGNILVPLCEMMGLPFDVGPKRHGFTTSYRWGHVEKLYRFMQRIEKLPLPKVTHGNYITVTLRETIKFKYKDSPRAAWDTAVKALEDCGEKVIVLDDSDATGSILTPQKRLEIYAGAKLNMGSGGPMSLCLFSEAPYLVTNLFPRGWEKLMREEFAQADFDIGSQFSFRNSRQMLSWDADTPQSIMAAYRHYWEQQEEVAA
jgi:hypothetical protein